MDFRSRKRVVKIALLVVVTSATKCAALDSQLTLLIMRYLGLADVLWALHCYCVAFQYVCQPRWAKGNVGGPTGNNLG